MTHKFRLVFLCLAATTALIGPGVTHAAEPAVTTFDTPKTHSHPVADQKPILANPLTLDIFSVDGTRTPSGFHVPRFVSLKFGKVNARTGPSRNHAIAYQYQRRGLPLIVVAETEMWRKVRDLHGDEAWVRKPALSGNRHAVLMSETTLYKKPSPDSRRLARIAEGALVHLEDCTDEGYCRIQTRNGLKGFASRDALWGAQRIN